MPQPKQLKDLTIQDDFMFQKVMQNPEICKKTLEIILNIEIDKIDYPEREKEIEAHRDYKGVRLDVYVKDDAGTAFDVEMQVEKKVGGYLAKRLRYYQSNIDSELLGKGSSYRELNNSFVIFICPFDEFKLDRHIYTFKERCLEDGGLLLGDGTTKVILNTKGTLNDVSEDVLAFLNYVDGMNVVGNDFVDEIKEEVEKVRRHEKWGKDYMYFRDMLQEERLEGKDEGREEAQMMMIKNMKTEGLDPAVIAKVSGWSAEKIAAVQ